MKPSTAPEIINAARTINDHNKTSVERPSEFVGDEWVNLQVYRTLSDSIYRLVQPKVSGYETKQFTPKLTIAFDEGRPVELSLGVEDYRGCKSLTANWFSDGERIYREEVSYAALGPLATDEVNNFAWSFVQYRDAVLRLSLEEAIEAGFSPETHAQLVRESGGIYLAP